MSDNGCKNVETPEFLATVDKKVCKHCGTTTVSPKDLTTLEREVVEKAEALVKGNLWGRLLRLDERGLVDAVDALRAARKPQGVRPEGWYWLRNPQSPHRYENCWRPAHLTGDEKLMSGWELGPAIPLPLTPQEPE